MKLGIWDAEMLSDLKYFDGSVQGDRAGAGRGEAALQNRFRDRADVASPVRGRAAEMDRPVAIGKSFPRRERCTQSVLHVSRSVGARPQDDLLSAHDQQVLHRFGQSRSQAEADRGDGQACSIEAMRNGTVCESCQ